MLYIIFSFCSKSNSFFFPLRFYFFQKFDFCFAAPLSLPFPADFCRKGYFRYNAANNKNYVDFLNVKNSFPVFISYPQADGFLFPPPRSAPARNTRAAFFRKEKDAFKRLFFSGGIPSPSFHTLSTSGYSHRNGKFFSPCLSYVSSKRMPSASIRRRYTFLSHSGKTFVFSSAANFQRVLFPVLLSSTASIRTIISSETSASSIGR